MSESEWDVHPLVAIFISRNNIMNAKNTEQQERDLLARIPFLEKAKLNEAIALFRRHKTLSQVVESLSLHVKFEKQDLKDLRNAISTTISSDVLIVTACFSCLVWFLDRNRKRSSGEFRELCSILTHFAVIDSKWCNVTSFSFKKLLKGAMSEQNGIEWKVEAFRAVFAHFVIAANLKSDVFKYFMRFCQLCSESEIPEVIVELHTMTYSLISERRACLDWTNLGQLIFLFATSLNALDRRCVMLLAKLSMITESQPVIDSIMLLPPALLNQASGGDVFQRDVVKDEEMDMEMDEVLFADLPMKFEDVDRFEDGIALLPFEILDDRDPVAFMSPRFRESFDTISAFIPATSEGGRYAFLEAYRGLLGALNGTKQYLEMWYAFITIWIQNKSLLDVSFVVSMFKNSGIFDYRETIYKKSSLSPVVNYMRNMIFANLDVHSIYPLLESAARHPFLLTEHLTRILVNWTNLKHCSDEKILRLAIQAAHQMRFFASEREAKEYIWLARSHNFTFLFRVCSYCKLLASPVFSDGFLWFVFDRFVRCAVLNTFKENLARFEHGEVGPTCNYLCKVLKMCAVDTTDEKSELAEAVALSIRNGLVINPIMINQFEATFTDLFELLNIYRSKKLLDYCLSIWELYTQVKIEKVTKAKHMKIFADCIHAIYGNDVPNDIDKHLCNLMSCCSCMTDFEHFHIKKPSVIPLVLFCYGHSSKCAECIRKFHRLCQFSRFNIRSCVDGDLDTIFLDFMFQNKEEAVVSYRGLDIVIKLKFSEMHDVLMPFLKTLFYLKSSNAVANRFAQLLVFGGDASSGHIYEDLADIIAYSISMPRPRIEIGTMPPPFTIRGFTSSEFAGCFTVTFLASFDFASLFASNASVFICSISDGHLQTVRFYVNHASMFVRVEIGDKTRVRQLVRCLPPSSWLRIRIMCERLPNGMLEIRTVCGYERKNPTSIPFGYFSGDDVFVEIGGYENLEAGWVNTELIILSQFAIYPLKWDRKEKKDTSIVPLFTTDRWIPHDRARRKGDKQKWIENNIGERTHNLLFYLLKGLFSNSVSQYFRILHPDVSAEQPKMVIALLDQIFSLSKVAQVGFMGVDAITNYLITNPKMADLSMFHCLVSIFSLITHEPLINEWFSKLIVNMWIWCRGSKGDFEMVLYYLSKVLVFQYPEYFKRNSCISRLINQFFIMFHMNKKLIHVQFDVPLGEGETSAFCERNRELFELFVKRACFITFAQEDADLLFYHLLNAPSDDTTLTILRMMVDVSSSVLLVSDNVSNNLAATEKLLATNNLDILELSILLIHKLSGKGVYSHMLAITYQLFDHPEQAALFDRLLARMPTYPNIHGLISILAMRIGGEYLDLAAGGLRALCSSESYLQGLDYSEYWFIWTFLLALNCPDRARSDVCIFLATASSLGPHPVLDIDIMVALYEAISTYTDCSCDFTFDLLNAYAHIPTQSQELLRHCISCLFYSTFYHCAGAMHEDALIAAYNNSPYCDVPYQHPPQPKLGIVVSCPLTLELLLAKNLKELPIRYGMRLRSDGEWIDAKRSTLALSLCSHLHTVDPKTELTQNVLRYMTDTASLSAEWRAQLRAHMDIMFEQLRIRYMKTVQEDLARAQAYLTASMVSAKTLVGKALRVSLDEYRKASIESLKSELELGGVIEDTAETFKSCYIRSRIISSPGCPFSMKRTRRHRKRHVVATNPVFEGKCVRVKIDQEKEYICRIDNKRIVLAESKFIRLKDISMMFTRNRNNRETAIEILTTDGRSILLDFTPLESKDIVQTLAVLPMPNAKIFQRVSSPELLSNLGLTRQWASGLMTNFEYILKLNIISGRSFSDRSMYPFFPSILSNYHDCNQIRDFSMLTFHEPHLDGDISLQSLFEQQFLVIPEYYYTSCVIKDDAVLPNWACSKYEFVHKLRKLFETNSVSRLIPLWADKLFGVKKLGGVHRQLFTAPHPRRRIASCPEIAVQHLGIRNIEIDRCVCLQETKGELKFVFRLKSGTIMTLNVNVANFMDSTAVVNFKTPSMGRYTLSSFGDIVAIANRDNEALLVISDNKVVSYRYLADTDFVFCGFQCVIFCPDSTSIAIQTFGGSGVKVLWRLNSKILAMECNWKFKIFAFAGVDNVARVGSCRTGKEINHYDIGSEVLKILITPSMGYILLLTLDSVVLLNIDGEFIKRVPFHERLRNWFVFSDSRGVDFVAIETENYQIGYFEAFYPESPQFFYETQSELKLIAFDSWSESFVIVRRNGKLTLVPHKLAEK